MGFELPDHFEILEIGGLRAMRPRQTLGRRNEMGRVNGNNNWLRSRLAAASLLSWCEEDDPYETTNSASASVVVGVWVNLSEGRYGTGGDEVTVDVDAEQGTITVEALDASATVLDSVTTSPTTRATNTVTLHPGVSAFLLQISAQAASGMTCKVYRVDAREREVAVGDLKRGGYQPRVVERFAAGVSHSCEDLWRLVDMSTQVNQDQLLAGGYAVGEDHPEVFASLDARRREWVLPVSPEAAQVQLTVYYQVHGAGVRARWSPGLRGSSTGEATDYTDLTDTSGRLVYEETLDLEDVHAAGLEEYGLRLSLWSNISTDPGDVFTYTVKGWSATGGAVEVNESTISDWPDAFEAALVEFLDGSGDPINDGRRYQLVLWIADGTFRIYPWASEEVQNNAASIQLTRAGWMEIFGVFLREVHGTPYGGIEQRFPWEDAAAPKRSLVHGRALVSPHHAVLYAAGEYLVSRRTPLLRWGSHPSPSSNPQWRSFGVVEMETVSPGNSWQTLARCNVGGDATFKRQVPTERTLQRRSLEVFGVILGLGSRARYNPEDRLDERGQGVARNDAVPVEVRLRRLLPDGTVTVTGDELPLDIVSAALPDGYVHQIFGDTTGISNLTDSPNNLQGLFPKEQVWQIGHPFRLSCLDEEAVEGTILELQIRPVFGEEGSLDSEREEEFPVALLSWYVRPIQGAQWDELLVEV